MANEKHAGGRPTKYKAEYSEQAKKLCFLGFTDKQLADFFNITESTLYKWKTEHREFSESLIAGKEIADGEIALSLYERAKGYSHPEDKIFNQQGTPMVVPTIKHYPPDTSAIALWLKNRQPDKWREKQEIEHTVSKSVIDELREKYQNK